MSTILLASIMALIVMGMPLIVSVSQYQKGALRVNMLTDFEMVGLLKGQIQHCEHMFHSFVPFVPFSFSRVFVCLALPMVGCYARHRFIRLLNN